MFYTELLQTLQFLIMLIIIMFVTYRIIHSFKYFARISFSLKDKSASHYIKNYVRFLTVVNYESYHKYRIWRYYVFSL
jgi:hypothetical protein